MPNIPSLDHNREESVDLGEHVSHGAATDTARLAVDNTAIIARKNAQEAEPQALLADTPNDVWALLADAPEADFVLTEADLVESPLTDAHWAAFGQEPTPEPMVFTEADLGTVEGSGLQERHPSGDDYVLPHYRVPLLQILELDKR